MLLRSEFGIEINVTVTYLTFLIGLSQDKVSIAPVSMGSYGVWSCRSRRPRRCSHSSRGKRPILYVDTSQSSKLPDNCRWVFGRIKCLCNSAAIASRGIQS